jgi:hypothetical protein
VIADLGLADGDRDAGALVLAAMRRDDEGLRVVAGNLADPAATSARLARLIATALDYDPEAAEELAGILQRAAGMT